MSTQWHISRGGAETFGPYSEDQLREFVSTGRLSPGDLLWNESMADWVPASTIPGLFAAGAPQGMPQGGMPQGPPQGFQQGTPQGYQQASPYASPYQSGAPQRSQSGDSNKVAAGVVAILIGSLGIHKFILGLTTPGVIMLLVTLLTCGFGGIVMSIIGIVEGIIYLTRTDAEFHQTYVIEKKGWF